MAKAPQIETLKLKTSQFMAAIRLAKRARRALFGWGPPGVAKSRSAEKVATDEGIAFVDVRLSQFDPTDLRGMPYRTEFAGEQVVRWSQPLVLPRDLDLKSIAEAKYPTEVEIRIPNPTGSNGIHYIANPVYTARALEPGKVAVITSQSISGFEVTMYVADENGAPTGTVTTGTFQYTIKGKAQALVALEEFNSAPPSVTAASYQLILDYRLGEYIVPKGCYLIAMGNRDTDRGVTFKMPDPVKNRFDHVEVFMDPDEWLLHAVEKMFHPEVVAYISTFKNHLFDFSPGTASRGFATPRTWEFASDFLYANEEEDVEYEVLAASINGAVGDGIGVQFLEFRKFAKDLPQVDDILSGRLTTLDTYEIGEMEHLSDRRMVEISLSYALTTTICYELKLRADKVRQANGAKWNESEDRRSWLLQADHFLKFMLDNFTPEICIMGAKIAIAIHALPFDVSRMQTFDTFAGKFKHLIMTQ